MSAFTRSTALKRQLELRARAHAFRQHLSVPEQLLWDELRASRLGVAFRRQVVVLGFIADFLAPALHLIVEIDGATHRQRRVSDASRDSKLRRLGYTVLRIEAQVVLGELPRAVEAVRLAIAALSC